MRALALIWTVVVVLYSSLGQAEIRKSARSRTAVESVRPLLEAEMNAKGLRIGSRMFIRIFKASNELEVWVEKGDRYEHFKTYPICYYSGYLGPKKRVGDRQAPEGVYSLKAHSMNPTSSYHLSMNVGYPNSYDRSHGRTGSAIMIHGDCVSIGCFAMTNARIERIYAMVEASLESGQDSIPLHIFPFRMTLVNMFRYIRFDAHAFWRELRPVYVEFEETRRVPAVVVTNGRYVLK